MAAAVELLTSQLATVRGETGGQGVVERVGLDATCASSSQNGRSNDGVASDAWDAQRRQMEHCRALPLPEDEEEERCRGPCGTADCAAQGQGERQGHRDGNLNDYCRILPLPDDGEGGSGGTCEVDCAVHRQGQEQGHCHGRCHTLPLPDDGEGEVGETREAGGRAAARTDGPSDGAGAPAARTAVGFDLEWRPTFKAGARRWRYR